MSQFILRQEARTAFFRAIAAKLRSGGLLASSDLAILPPTLVAAIIKAGGFGAPVQFYQAGLIHAWFSKRVFRAAT